MEQARRYPAIVLKESTQSRRPASLRLAPAALRHQLLGNTPRVSEAATSPEVSQTYQATEMTIGQPTEAEKKLQQLKEKMAIAVVVGGPIVVAFLEFLRSSQILK